MWKKIFFQTAKKCSIRTMIRFVYPNVNAAEQFVGCGRYFATTPDDPCLTNGYTIAEPNVGHLSKVTTAASLLAKESFDSDREIYESQDDPTAPYVGDSMGLAYLLALIHRSRLTVWEQSGRSLDIWCTGAIEVGGMPLLHNVYRNLFAVKLQAFLADENALLFIVPVANLEPKHRQLVWQQHVRVLSLDQVSTSSVQEIVDSKTILQVHGDELAVLVNAIFEPSSTERETPFLNQRLTEAATETEYLSTATKEEFGGGNEISSTGFFIFGLLTFWIYTVWTYHKIVRAHLQARLWYFKRLLHSLKLSPEHQQICQTLIERGFTPKERPKYLSMSLYLLSMLLILLCYVLNAFGIWAGRSSVADLLPEEIARALNFMGPKLLSFLDRALFLIVAGAAFLFCVSSVYFLSWVCKTTKDHEYYELLLAKLISNPDRFKMVRPSNTFIRRWNKNQNWIALFLILSLPMTFSPLMVVKYMLDRGDNAVQWLFIWTLVVFLCAAIFHFWGTQILIGMFNGHIRIETVNQHYLSKVTPWISGTSTSVLDETIDGRARQDTHDLLPKRTLAAIMITDMVGFSKDMEQNEEDTYSKLLTHNEILRIHIVKNNGQEIKTIGDAFLVRFHSAVDAVRAAVGIQHELSDYNHDKAESEHISVRIGVHIGDVLLMDRDIIGNGVNVAAQIKSLAEPGGICISADIYNIVKQSLDIQVVSLGKKDLKNIQDAPELYRIVSESMNSTTTL